jgi:hypothetical protein
MSFLHAQRGELNCRQTPPVGRLFVDDINDEFPSIVHDPLRRPFFMV